MSKFQPGQKKTGGRKPGTPNKRTQVLSETLAQLGLDVPRELVRCLRIKRAGALALTVKERADILLQLMNYLYPKRKAVELTGKGGGPMELYLQMTPDERERRRLELEKRLGKP